MTMEDNAHEEQPEAMEEQPGVTVRELKDILLEVSSPETDLKSSDDSESQEFIARVDEALQWLYEQRLLYFEDVSL